MWGIGAVIAILIAIGLWMTMKNTPAAAGENAPRTQASAEKSSGSLAALVARGATVQCSVDQTNGGETTKGTVFVSGKKVRGDFQSTIPKVGPVESHMISDGEYVYVWSTMMPRGIKMKASAATPQDIPGKTAPTQNPYSQNYDYNCTAWGADASKFDLPAGVTFNDMSAMMPKPPVSGDATGSAKVPAPNCSMCDQAPASARAQCKAALGCK